MATSQFAFAWFDNSGSFHIQTSQVAEGVPPGSSLLFTASGGNIRVTPSIDLSLTIDAAWTFNLPMDWMETTLLVRVRGAGSHEVLFGQTTGGQTQPGYPDADTVYITGNVILPPGETWILSYEMSIDTHGGTQGYFGTGDGYVNFTVQAIPEPATVILFTLAAWPFLRRTPPISRRRDLRAARFIFTLHPSPFTLHPSPFILHPSSFRPDRER